MDVRHYSEDEDMDQEDEDQDVEMEYGDDVGSDTSSSGSDHEEDVDHRTPDSGEVWDDEGDEEEEDLVEQRDEEEEEEEVGDDNDEGEDEEEEDIMWEVRWTPNSTPLMTLNRRLQDIQEGEGALGMALEDVDNEAGHGGNCYFVRGDRFTDPFMVVPIHINHEEDEPDMGSDEEEFVLQSGNFNNDGIFSFGDIFVNPGSRDGGGLFIHRRHRGNGMLSPAKNILMFLK